MKHGIALQRTLLQCEREVINVNWKFANGDKVKHVITGFSGIIVARTEFLNGCRQYAVQSEKLHGGKPIESEWIDEGQLELVTGTAALLKKLVTSPNRGGPARGVKMPKA